MPTKKNTAKPSAPKSEDTSPATTPPVDELANTLIDQLAAEFAKEDRLQDAQVLGQRLQAACASGQMDQLLAEDELLARICDKYPLIKVMVEELTARKKNRTAHLSVEQIPESWGQWALNEQGQLMPPKNYPYRQLQPVSISEELPQAVEVKALPGE